MVWFLFLIFFQMQCSEKPANHESDWKLRFEKTWQNDSLDWVMTERQLLAKEAPKSKYGYYCKSWILAQEQNFDEALKTVDSLLVGFPDFDKAWYLRGNLRAQRNDTSGAFRDFAEGLKRNPAFFEIYINRGALYYQYGNWSLALNDFERALKLKPTDGKVFSNLGNVQFQLQRPEVACYFWQKADSLGDAQAGHYFQKYCRPKN